MRVKIVTTLLFEFLTLLVLYDLFVSLASIEWSTLLFIGFVSMRHKNGITFFFL